MTYPAPPITDADADRSEGWLRLLWGFVGPARRMLVVSIAAAVLTTAIITATPLVSRIVVDNALNPRHPAVRNWLITLFVLGVIRFFATRARRWRAGQVS